MMTCIMPSATAASVPGRTCTNWSANAVVRFRWTSMWTNVAPSRWASRTYVIWCMLTEGAPAAVGPPLLLLLGHGDGGEVAAPGEVVGGGGGGLWVGPPLAPHGVVVPSVPAAGATSPREQTGPEPMEQSAVHAGETG